MFRSTLVRHEVLPAHAPRFALTAWLYARRPTPSSSTAASIPRPLSRGLSPPPSRGTIFVSVVSYRDPECQHTLHDLFRQADVPERVFVGLCLQVHPVHDTHCFKVPIPRKQQVRVLRFHCKQAAGPAWARYQVQALLRGEDFILQVDSHTRFVRGWDTKLIAMLRQCEVHAPKPVLSTYPAGYHLPSEVGGLCCVVSCMHLLKPANHTCATRHHARYLLQAAAPSLCCVPKTLVLMACHAMSVRRVLARCAAFGYLPCVALRVTIVSCCVVSCCAVCCVVRPSLGIAAAATVAEPVLGGRVQFLADCAVA